MEDRYREYFRAFFAYIQSRLKISVEEIARLAGVVLEEMWPHVKPIAWDTAERRSVRELKRKTVLYSSSRVVAFVTRVLDPQLISIRTADGQIEHVETTSALIQDRHGDAIWLLNIVGTDLIDKVQSAHRSAGPIELLGVPLAVPIDLDPKRPDAGLHGGRKDFVFEVIDLRDSYGCLDLLGATKAERELAQVALQVLSESGTPPLEYLRSEILRRLNIVGTEEFPLLGQLIEFSVLQALSAGFVGQASARLHLLLVGPPGQGKKLVGLAARVLNPTAIELSPAKATPAGLVGASHITGKGWGSKPGALAQAAHGVAALQDAQGWKQRDLAQIAPILQEVMEDAVVRDSSAGGIIRSAPVAIHVDLNRASQVGMGQTSEAAILRNRPLLSRFDLIAEIQADPERAWTVAERMYDRRSGTLSGPLEAQGWVREARLLIAALRDRHPVIDLEPVRALMMSAFRDLHQANRALFAHMPEASDLPARLTNTFDKIVIAYARGADRSGATEEDVHRALDLLNMKLEFFRMHGGQGVSGCPRGQDGRREWVGRKAQSPVNPEDLADQYHEETGHRVHAKTFMRDLDALGARKVGPGRYLLPPPAQTT